MPSTGNPTNNIYPTAHAHNQVDTVAVAKQGSESHGAVALGSLRSTAYYTRRLLCEPHLVPGEGEATVVASALVKPAPRKPRAAACVHAEPHKVPANLKVARGGIVIQAVAEGPMRRLV